MRCINEKHNYGWVGGKRHNNHAVLVFKVMEPTFKVFGFRARLLSSHVTIGDCVDHENLTICPYYIRMPTVSELETGLVSA